MSGVGVATSYDRTQWNGLLRRSGSGHFFQAWQWADLLRELRCGEPRFFTLGGPGEEPSAGLVVHKEFLLGIERPALARAVTRLPLLGPPLTVYRWRHGPAVAPSEDEGEALGILLGAAEERARQEGILAVEGITLARYSDASTPSLVSQLRELGYESTPWATYLVDLSPSEDELLGACDRSVRKNVRRCAREGVKVERVDSLEGWREFASLLNESRRRQGLRARPEDLILLHNERLNGDEERLIELFTARHNGRAIAALAVLAYNGWMTEAMSATSDYALEQRLPAQDLLKWEIMQWGKDEGFHTFDLAGVAPSPGTDKEAGIRRFKAKFGGRYVEYGTYRKVFRPGLYRLLMGLRRLRRS